MTPDGRFIIGLDLGKLRDFTAVCVVQHRVAELAPRRQEIHFDDQGKPSLPGQKLRATRYNVGHLRRFKLGTPYPHIVEEVRALRQRLPGAPELVVDATGCGLPVLDYFNQAGLKAIGVLITGGDRETHEGRLHRVPKQNLVSVVDRLMQSGELKIQNRLPDAQVLRRELDNFEVGYTGTGHMTFSARVGQHDDLVLSLAIALWRAVYHRPLVISDSLLEWASRPDRRY
jgi:hypothetical protein